MSTTFRALCAELLQTADTLLGQGESPANPGERLILTVHLEELEDCANRTRAALAQPELVAPTDEDVTELFYRHMGEGSEVGFENAIAEALARWGTPGNNTSEEI